MLLIVLSERFAAEQADVHAASLFSPIFLGSSDHSAIASWQLDFPIGAATPATVTGALAPA